MTTLALDTATAAPGLALLQDDRPVAELWLGASSAGGRRVLEGIHHLLRAAGAEPADLTRIVVGVGPGGFTGLRIGVATALGLGQALDIPVVGASSLEALAAGIGHGVGNDGFVAPVIDARRGEVFAAVYRVAPDRDLQEIVPPAAWHPGAFAAAAAHGAPSGPIAVAGDGLAAHLDPLSVSPLVPIASDHPAHRVSAVDLARRADRHPRPAMPTYLRVPDAEVNRRRADEGPDADRASRPAA